MKTLLDSNAYSALMRGNAAVADRVRRSARVFLSAIVVGEQLYGFMRGSRLERNLRDLNRFLSNPYVDFLPVTQNTADRYARIALSLRKKGTPIPTNDIWIAAHAMETGADLISFDPHFKHIDSVVWICPNEG